MTEQAAATDPLAGIKVLEHIVEQHADEAAFCWEFRDAACVSPAYNLDELCEVDERLEAHLDGLRIAADIGWRLCLEQLDEDEPGTLFVAALMALERNDMPGFAEVLDAGAHDRRAARGIISALGWMPFAQVERPLRALTAPNCPPPLQRIGIAGYAAHRVDPGEALATAARSADPSLRARALRAIGQLCSKGHDNALRRGYQAADPESAFWSSWSGALLGDGIAVHNLIAIAEGGALYAEPAADMAVRRMDPQRAMAWIHKLAAAGEQQQRAAMVGTGALGAPSLVPWLIEQMHTPELARLAAGAFAQMTGANVAEELDLLGPAPIETGPDEDASHDDVALDPDDDWPWPEPAKVAAWWQQSPLNATTGARLLWGQPMAPSWLSRIVAAEVPANQLARQSAALELTLRRRTAMPAELRATGQKRPSPRGRP